MALPATVQDRLVAARFSFLALALLSLCGLTTAQQNAAPPSARITAAIDESRLVILRGNTHPLARAAYDRGPAPTSLPMARMLLVLRRSADQEAALDTLLEQQQDASSANFHQWLTPQQFGQQYGPADQDIQTITSWLQSRGFQVAGVSNGRTVIEFSGTAGQVRDAFHTEIHQYNVNGENHWANSSDPQIPQALAPVIAGIDTLHNFPRSQFHELAGTFTRAKATGAIKRDGAQFTFPNPCNPNAQPFCNFGLAPADFSKIYNVPNLTLSPASATVYNGDGVTIAIIDQSNINPQDLADFHTLFGLPAPKLNVILSGPDPGLNDAETEAILDVQWASAVAPDATIDFVIAQSTEASLGADLAAQYAVDNNLAPIVSESYGLCEFDIGASGNTFYNQLWQQAAAQGITALVSSGDSGSAACERGPGHATLGVGVSGFASTPYNVAVGGTDFNDINDFATFWNTTPQDTPTTASAKGYIPEMTWNSSCTNQEIFHFFDATTAEQTCNNATAQQDGYVEVIGGSGGKSSCINSNGVSESSCTQGYAKPSWQTALTPNDGARDIPDLSLFASNGFNGSFYLICEADLNPWATSCDPYAAQSDFGGVGGTSVAVQVFAGIMALINEATGSRQGNANYILYPLAAQSGATCASAASPAGSCVFYDVPTGSTIAMPCGANTPNCTVVTGGDAVGVLSGYASATGYDLATGLGSVNAANLISKWTAFHTALKSSATTLTLNSGNAVNITHGQSVTTTIGVTGTPGTPTGNVSLVADTGASGSEGVQAFLLSSGSASGSTNLLPGGTYNVVAQYPGDGTFGSSSSAPIPVTVAPETSRAVLAYELFNANGAQTSPNAISATFGTSSLLRINVTSLAGDACVNNSPSSTGCPTGSVTVTDNGGALDGGTFTLNAQGYTEDQFVNLQGGPHGLVATYSGDNSFTASAPASESITITPAPTSISVTANLTNPLLGSFVGFTANLAAAGIFSPTPPGGTITFLAGTATLATVPIISNVNQNTGQASGVATTGSSALVHGPNSVTVQYSGDANYGISTSLPIIVTVYYPSSVVVVSSSPSIQTGTSVNFTAAVTTTQNGGPAISGTVQFSVDGSLLGAPIAVSNGQALVSTSFSSSGQHTVIANYSGDSNYSSSGNSTTEMVTPGPTFTVTANPTTISVPAPGQSGSTLLTFTAQNGFSSGGTITLTPAMCVGLPSETSCSFSPSTISIAANGTATTALSVLTTAPSSTIPTARNPGGNWPATGAATLALLLALWSAFALDRRRTAPLRTAAMVLAFGLLLAVAACGGGGHTVTNPGTPAPADTQIAVSFTINGVTQTVPNLFVNVQ